MTNGHIIVNRGKRIILNRAYKASPDYTVPSRFKIGYSNGTPLVADTDLDNPYPISGTEVVDNCDATAGWAATADGAITLNTTAGQFKEGTGTLNLAKTGATVATITFDKTTTSRDFTSKRLFVWLYLEAVTDLLGAGTAVSIRFGSSSGDYYQKNYLDTALSNGWNLLNFTSAEADSTSGAPAIAACDYTAVVLNFDLAADTMAAPRCRIDDIKLASTDDFIKTFVSGYPTFDETNHEVTIQCFVSSTEGNGITVNGFGLFNTDGTVLMHSEDTFTGESKGTSDEFTFTVIDRIE